MHWMLCTLSGGKLVWKSILYSPIYFWQSKRIWSRRDWRLFYSGEVECRWSDWSSCSYYCGDPKVETRYKALVDVNPKGSRAMCAIPQEECGTISCTGNTCRATGKHKVPCLLPDPFIYGEWDETDLCTETCGKEGKLLEKRSCTSTTPDKSCASLPTNETLRPGNKPCGDEPCNGYLKVCFLLDQLKSLQEHSPNGLTGQTARQTARMIQTMLLWLAPR